MSHWQVGWPLYHTSLIPTQRDDLNKVLERSKSGLAFYDTVNRPKSPGKAGSSKPDLGMFCEDDMNRGHLKDTHEPVEGGDSCDFIYTASMGKVYMFVEVNVSDLMDPFTDPPDDNIPPGYRFTIDTSKQHMNSEEMRCRVKALGQNTCYAHTIHTRQFRTCVYSISIAGSTARLLRWDRSGVVVTRRFDYKSNPKPLIDFTWRFSKAADKDRGFDLSAVAVDSEGEREQFVDAIRRHVEAQLPGMSAKDTEIEVGRHCWPGAVTRLNVETDMGAYGIWVSRPVFTSKRPTGRSTTGYWGVDCESGEVVFVKDVWCTDVPGVETEGAILQRLSGVGVRNIPGLVCHGDVGKSSCFLFT